MKLKVVVVDLELTRGQKRVGVAGLAVAGALAAGAALADVPKTFAAGETLKAADLNSNFESLDERVAALEAKPTAPTITAWAPYTPTVTANGTPLSVSPVPGEASVGHWRRVGDTLEVELDSYHPTCTPVGELQWSLPDGLQPDTTKLPSTNTHIGTAILVKASPFDVKIANVLAQGANTFVAVQVGTSVGVCSHVGPGGDARMTFSIPIDGWGVAN